ncbi:MAG: hypothetical protein CALGDGBN_01316 [Pseudomonadales bacterium]|nr:hypothetical protein [Pseudomonadales bacterium]
MRTAIVPIALALLLAACAGTPARAPSGLPDAAALLAGTPLGAHIEPAPAVALLAVDQPMREFVTAHVGRRASASQRLRQLLQAIVSDASFGLVYTNATHDAAGTFALRNGNCLSFTALFVALAREAKLEARFQEVDIPPDWERRGEFHVLNRHVNALVDLGGGVQKAVDFDVGEFRASYERRAIDDRRALAHFHSNRAVERLAAGALAEAFAELRAGITADPDFAPLWVNLGAVYQRAGAPPWAEASWLEALRRDSTDTVAMSNLARLYEARGDAERATHYQRLVQTHREGNPYFRYQRARAAFFDGRAREALPDLDFAIRRRPVEDSFFLLRAMVHLRLGDAERARADLERAAEVAADETARRNYSAKMEQLFP